MVVGMSWRRATAISVFVHFLLLAGSGHLFAGLFPETVINEQYIELDFQNEPQVAATVAKNIPAPEVQQTNTQPALTAPAAAHQPRITPQPVAVNQVSAASAPAPTEPVVGTGEAEAVTAAADVGSSVPSGSQSGGIAPPGVLSRVEPVYPHAARQAGINGTVVVKVQVLENGNPGNIVLLRTSGNDSLDEAAIDAVQQWRFVPARNRDTGRTVACVTTIPVSFRLNG
ncbi:energy transducer TonB [Sporomusa sp. KB1]|jgi:protein TonB|uniref:energy transducer TonB n=1 Tax=Sporomusa sp. KB1 TaxID=943346 RepID=UPI00119F6A4B|nr:energy transducer TonB [Sporomusa sp. KB1]TWH49182.1 protein TonB [Sporomusa sp. KB1]